MTFRVRKAKAKTRYVCIVASLERILREKAPSDRPIQFFSSLLDLSNRLGQPPAARVTNGEQHKFPVTLRDTNPAWRRLIRSASLLKRNGGALLREALERKSAGGQSCVIEFGPNHAQASQGDVA